MGPTYDLGLIRRLVRAAHYRITLSAAAGARAKGFCADDILQCLLELQESDFHKTMPSTKLSGRWQDVYRPTYLGIQLYLKVQIAMGSDRGTLLVIISFKEL